MTRKDFQALATIVKNTVDQGGSIGAEKLASELAALGAETNSAFDSVRFFEACGLTAEGSLS